MTDYFEVDFLDVETDKSGDAITVRYQVEGVTQIHVIDGGFQETGPSVVEHIRKYYGNAAIIDRVIVTHPDGDHAGGLRTILEEMTVRELWMLRPWAYADELMDRFAHYQSVERLTQRLRSVYPNLAALEEIAIRRRIPIGAPFQGAVLGAFRVLAPSKERYLDLVVASEKTPESVEKAETTAVQAAVGLMERVTVKVAALLKALWGQEVFSPNETSAENEMSVVQHAIIAEQKIMLTADAGRAALTEAADYCDALQIALPGVGRFQVPHHGSRRNVSTEVLDRLLGPRLGSQPTAGAETFTAVVSSAKKDERHPRKAVVRAMVHRGGRVIATEGSCKRVSQNAPDRPGWVTATPLAYPDEQEGN